jgi:peptide/nickel transport system substrate-binding protein
VQSDTSSEASARRGADIRTFLFADVRGYTRYTHEHGDEAASALTARFADIVRHAVPKFEGELLELRGDEALCVFSSARQALRAAVALQRSFRKRVDGEPVLPVGIGMGLDAGEAVPTQGGFRGGALNVAARLCALAAPGQVLATETVVGLARRVEGLRFQPRRPVRVKGVAEPVRLVEVVSEEPLPPTPVVVSQRRSSLRRVVAVTVVAIAAVVALVLVAAVQLGEGSHSARLGGDSVAALSSSGSALTSASLGGEPSAIAVGHGAVWVAETTTDRVSEVSLRSGRIVNHLAVGRAPSAIAVDSTGRLWVANDGDGTVSWLDPAAAARPLLGTIRVGNGPVGIAVGLGSVWVANRLDDTVTRINEATGHVVRTIPLSAAPDAVTVADAAVWVATDATNDIVRISPHPPYPEQAVPAGGDGPVALAGDGASIWVANQSSDTVTRLDVRRGFLTAAVPVGRSPSAIAVSDGAVWVADKQSGKISMIDPHAPPHVERTLVLGGDPTAVAAGARGRTWVAALPPLSSHRGGTLRIAAIVNHTIPDDDLATIDPAAIFYYAGAVPPVWDVYDGLVGYRRVAGSAGATIVPDLATSIPTPTDGGRTWTFHLRSGLRYSNGEPVRASDVRRAVERLFPLGSIAATYFTFNHLVGQQRCQRKLLALEKHGAPPYPIRCDLRGAITTNDRSGTVVFHLTSPDPAFLQELAEPYADPVPLGTPNHDVGAHAIPGTGPYEIAQFHKDHSILLVRNPSFHEWSYEAQPDGYPNRIVINAYPSSAAEFHAVEAGKADISWDSTPTGAFLPASVVRQATVRFPDQLKAAPFPLIHYLVLNTTLKPVSNPLVRRAISYAIDRHQAVSYVAGPPQAFPSCQYLPVDFPAYRPYCPSTITPNQAGIYHGPDIAKAQQLIAESGMKGAKITFWISTCSASAGCGPPDRRWGHHIVSVLDSIGLRAHAIFGNQLKVQPPDPSAPAQIFTQGWLEDFPLASDFLQPLFSCASVGSTNWSRFCSHRIDRQMQHASALQLSDPARANTLWEQVERELLRQPPMIPLLQQQWINLIGKEVGNYQLHVLIGPLVDQLWVK